MKPFTVSDYRQLARKNLPKFLFEYIDGGSCNEITLAKNLHALSEISLRQRVLKQDVSEIDLTANFLGKEYSMPTVLGPVALAGMFARRGEVHAARAAENKNIPFCLSTVGVCPAKEVSESIQVPPWFQLYIIRDRTFMKDLLQHIRELGIDVLVLTVDMAVPGLRYRDYHSGLTGAPGTCGQLRRLLQATGKPKWAWDVGIMGQPHHLGNVAPVLKGKTGLEDFLRWMSDNFDASITWKDLDFIRENWDGKILIKGILDPEDASEANKFGADGIVVSNHGGRQLDGVPSATDSLKEIASQFGDKMTIFADGGVRSGLDVYKMLACGANGVFLGRAWAYALAARGQCGVENVLETIKNELKVTMALSGVKNIHEINESCILKDNF